MRRFPRENSLSQYLQFTLYIPSPSGSSNADRPSPSRSARQVPDPTRTSGGRARAARLAALGARGRPAHAPRLEFAAGRDGRDCLLSRLGQSVTGRSTYSSDQITHHQPTVNWPDYLGSADFWQATLQNRQSEFLAGGSMAALSIDLRQRGSPESKPVGASHEATGVEG
jgi:uncharacterized protein DUF6766